MKAAVAILLVVTTSLIHADTFFRTYDIDGQECFIKAVELPDGRFAVMRKDESGGPPPYLSGLMFVDANGDSLDFSEEIFAYAFCLIDDSCLVFATQTAGFDWSLIWTDLYGNILGEEIITGIIPDLLYPGDIVQTMDGGFFFCGGDLAVKVDGSGSYEWHLYGTPCYESVTQGIDETFLAGGYSNNMDYIVNISTDGIIQWEWFYQGSETIWAVDAVSDGFVTASQNNSITKLSVTGDTLWSYSSEHSDVYYLGITVSGTDIVACGSSENDSLSVISRLDSNGLLIWEREYPDCIFGSIESTMDDGFILAGRYSYLSETESASLLMKIDSEGWYGETGIEPVQIVDELNLEIYPNPGTAYSIIKFNLDSSSPGSLQIFDIAGRCVMEFSEMQCNTGQNEFLIEGLGSGIYLCRMTVCSLTEIQSFVVIE